MIPSTMRRFIGVSADSYVISAPGDLFASQFSQVLTSHEKVAFNLILLLILCVQILDLIC